MPSSRPYALTRICQRIIELQPRSVLDIGVGFGKMGFLAREYTDVWCERYYSGAHFNRTRIDGIEAHRPYITEVHRQIYDNIYIGEAVDVMTNSRLFFPDEPYALILCCDMLEHLVAAEGKKLLALIVQYSERAIITTPHANLFSMQGAVYGNVYETHRYCWSVSDLAKWGKVTTLMGAMNLLEIGF